MQQIAKKRRSILTVEDDESIAAFLKDSLTGLGYAVIGASTGRDAVDLARTRRPDLLLIDTELAGETSGIAAAGDIRSWSDIPVVYLTGPSETRCPEPAGIAGPCGYVVKPVRLRALATAVETALRRHALDSRLRRSEQRFRSLFETCKDSILLIDRRTCSIVLVNPAACRLYGYPLDEFVRLKITDVSAEPEKTKACVAGAVPDVSLRLHRKKDGTVFPVEISGGFFTEDGVSLHTAFIRDISERTSVEQKLKESSLQLEEAADLAKIAYWEHDWTTDEFVFNDTFYELYGTTAEKEGGYRMPRMEYMRRFVHPDDLEELERQVARNRSRPRREGPEQYEHRAVRAGGEVIYILDRNRVVRDAEGRTAKVVGVNQDITEHKRMEEALREYEKVIENSPDAMVVVDAEYRYRAVNSAFLAHRGRDREHVIGHTIAELLSDAGMERIIRENLDRCFSGEAVQFEMRERHPGSEDIDIFVSCLPIFDAGGVDRVAATIRDVTASKKADEALRRSKRKYMALFETLRDGFASIAPDKKIVDANPSFLNMVGYTLEELRTMTYEDLSSGKWRTSTEDTILDQVMTRGYSDVYVKEYVRKDGTTFPAEIRAHLTPDEEDVPPGIWAFVRDVTERVKAEDALRESETKLRAILDGSRDAIGVSKDGALVFVNPAYASLFGYERADELMGKATPDLIAPADRERVMEILGKRRAGEWVPPFCELTGRKRDGTTFLMELSVSTYVLKGEHFALGILRDISEKRKLEEQLRHAQKMEAVGTLAGGVAHDFNNILTVIMGLANLMQMTVGADDILRPYIDQIVASSERAADLTRNLLAFSRKQRITLEPHTINGVVESTAKLLARLLPEDVVLETGLTREDTSSLVDVTQIGQVLMNLAANARDAMPHGGAITIRTERARLDDRFRRIHGFGHEGEYVRLSVSDTGAGMDKQTAERIFEPFFTTKEVGKGTGLGLASAYGIVKQHQGYITVSSMPSEGTTFDIYLPFYVSAPARDITRNAPAPGKGGNETVLVVEDDRDVRHMLSTVLRSHGYTTIAAVDGEDAIRVHADRKEEIDLAIVDVVMPGKNGREAYDAIKAVDPGLKGIFVSGYTGDIVIDKGIRSESADFLQKPISVETLLRKVREVLDRD